MRRCRVRRTIVLELFTRNDVTSMESNNGERDDSDGQLMRWLAIGCRILEVPMNASECDTSDQRE